MREGKLSMDSFEQSVKPSGRSTFWFSIRLTVYTLLLLGLLALLPTLLEQYGYDAVVLEFGFIENVQLALLALSVLIGFFQFYQYPAARLISLLFVILFGMAFAREMDSFFERVLPVVSWKGPFSVLIVTFIGYSYTRMRQFKRQLIWLMNQRSLMLFWFGLVTVTVVAQLLGHGDLLELIFQDHYIREHKRFTEESIEMVGYILLLYGIFEYSFDLSKSVNESIDSDS